MLIGSHGCRIEWYHFRWPWVTLGIGEGFYRQDLGFKVTVYLQVKYLKNGATLLNSTTYNCRPPGALPNTCKKIGGHRWKFCARRAEIFLPSYDRALYGKGRIKQRRRRRCRYDTINRFFCNDFRILPQNPYYTSSRDYFNWLQTVKNRKFITCQRALVYFFGSLREYVHTCVCYNELFVTGFVSIS